MSRHPYSHRLSYRPDLVLRRIGVKCVRKPCGLIWISPELVLRGPKQDCAENPNEISALNPELVLRDIPGKSAQRWRQAQRFRRSILLRPILNPSRDEVVRMTFSPRLLLLFPAVMVAIWMCA